jgi:hypothetical protein
MGREDIPDCLRVGDSLAPIGAVISFHSDTYFALTLKQVGKG